MRFSDIEMEQVTCASHIVIRKGNSGQRIQLERIRATLAGPGETASSLESWMEAPLRKIRCHDISILASGGGDENATKLPIEPPGVGARPLPVWGLYSRHVEALQLEQINLCARTPDVRPPRRLDEVTLLDLSQDRH